MGVIVRLLSPSAATVRKWAESLGLSVLRRNGGVASGFMRGFMARASGGRDTVIVTVIDPPGVIIVPEPLDPANGNAYLIGTRDAFDSRIGAHAGPFDRIDIPVASSEVVATPVGFPADSPDWVSSVYWPGHVASVRQSDRLRVGRIRVKSNNAGYFPYSLTDQIPVGDVVFSGVDVFPASGKAPSYYFNDAAIEALAPSYQSVARTSLGYMAFEYQGLPPSSAQLGTLTLMVFTVVKNLHPDQAVHWGHSGVLFVLLDSAKVGESEGAIIWSELWTPDAHASSFFHNGPWARYPTGGLSSLFSAPQASWDAFWSVPGADDLPGGSRPNWTDAVSVAAFNGRFVVTLRVCALNGAVSPTAAYTMAGGTAVMRFDIAPTGALAATEVTHEVWAFWQSTWDYNQPYLNWVAGTLDPDVVRSVNPMALLSTEADLIDVRLCVSANRNSLRHSIGGMAARALPEADLTTARLEVSIARLDSDGAELPPVVHSVFFVGLGAGLSCPNVYLNDKYWLIPPTQSYKLTPANNQFARLSEHELAFIVRAEWQSITVNATNPNSALSIAVLNLLTGVTTIRGAIGVATEVNISYARSEHLSCIQQAVYDENGAVVVEGVLLFSAKAENAMRISRDSGATWQEYITFPRPQSGGYYVGNQLMCGMRPGTVII